MRTLIDAGDRVEHPVPATLQAELRPYQREGFNWLAVSWGQILVPWIRGPVRVVGLDSCVQKSMCWLIDKHSKSKVVLLSEGLGSGFWVGTGRNLFKDMRCRVGWMLRQDTWDGRQRRPEQKRR